MIYLTDLSYINDWLSNCLSDYKENDLFFDLGTWYVGSIKWIHYLVQYVIIVERGYFFA